MTVDQTGLFSAQQRSQIRKAVTSAQDSALEANRQSKKWGVSVKTIEAIADKNQVG